MERFADLNKVRNYVKETMITDAMVSGTQIDVFGQSGYDFCCDQFEGYIAPADYSEIVTEMNWLS